MAPVDALELEHTGDICRCIRAGLLCSRSHIFVASERPRLATSGGETFHLGFPGPVCLLWGSQGIWPP